MTSDSFAQSPEASIAHPAPPVPGVAVIVPAMLWPAALAGGVAWRKAGSWIVWYFVEDYQHYVELSQSLPPGWTLAPVGETVNRVFGRLQESLINLDCLLLGINDDRLCWDASDIADRGPYLSGFGLDLVRAVVMVEAVRSGGNHVILVGNPSLARSLWQLARDNRLPVDWGRPGGRPGWRSQLDQVRETALGFVQTVVRRAQTAWGLVSDLRTLRRLRRNRPLPIESLRRADVLIMTWATIGTKTKAATFPDNVLKDEDEFFGNTPRILRDAGYRVGYLANPLIWMHPFPAIAESCLAAADPVLMLGDCLTFGEVWRVLIASLRSPFSLGRPMRLNELEITALVRREVWLEFQKGHSGQALLFLAVGQALHRQGISPKAVFFRYEGQPWEKLLANGLRRHCPETRVIGCQLSMFSDNYLSLYPSRADIALGRLPDKLLVSGERYADLLCRKGVPESRIAIAGTIRYQSYLAHLASLAALSHTGKPRSDTITILITTSIEYQESVEIVIKAALAAVGLAGLRLVVNFHPLTQSRFRQGLAETVAALVSPAAISLEYSEQNVQELLAGTDLVLYNSSGTAFDAMAAGLAIIYVGRDLATDQDKVPEEASVRLRSVSELHSLLAGLITNGGKRLPVKEAASALARCMADVRPEVIIEQLVLYKGQT